MRIAVLSGKGGTGKTLLSVNLAVAAKQAVYVDCDVEEPNGHLFLKPQIQETETIEVLRPKFNSEKCNACRTCVDFCAFRALAFVGDSPLLFPEVCHSCGGCALLCPQGAIEEVGEQIGEVSVGKHNDVYVLSGQMLTGKASGTPIIKRLQQKMETYEEEIKIIDCPPGAACIVMESIANADYCVLVAEPTIFGMDNLAMVYELVQKFEKPFGVVLNKCTEEGNNPSEEFCIAHKIPVLGRIPFDKELGAIASKGGIIAETMPKYSETFVQILDRIKEAPV